MKIHKVMTVVLVLFFSSSLFATGGSSSEEGGSSGEFASESRSFSLDGLEDGFGSSASAGSGTSFDKYLRGLDPGVAQRIKDRAAAKLESLKDQTTVRRRGGKSKTRNPILVALLEAQQEELELREAQLAIQQESLADAKESSKTSMRFAWAGLGLGVASFATALVFSLTNLIISVSSDPSVVECVCN